MHSIEQQEYWKVLYVSSRQEKKLSVRLQQLGIKNYLPIVKKLRIWSDRKKWVDFPMFNGYLFIQPEDTKIDLAVQQPGAVRYLMYNGKHAKVTQKEIDIIRSIESSGYFAESVYTADDFQEGEPVLISEGPLKGQTGRLLRKNNEQQFLIAIESIGQTLKVQIPMDMLIKRAEAE
jgi:transcription antitermination factor NusG